MTSGKRRVVLYVSTLVCGAGLLFAGFGITLPPDPATILHGAAMIGSMGQYGQAIEMTRGVLKDHPDHAEANLYLATFLSNDGRHEEALKAYDRAIPLQSGPIRRSAELDRASLLLVMGKLEAFHAERKRIQATGDFRSDVLDGLWWESTKDWEAATSAYERAHAARPEDNQIKSRLYRSTMEVGRIALGEGRFENAYERMDAARKLFPRSSEAHLQAAEIRLMLEDTDGAIEILRELPPTTPGIVSLVFRAATTQLANGDTEGALNTLAGAAASDLEAVRSQVASDPVWETMRDDDRVVAILTQLETENVARLTRPK